MLSSLPPSTPIRHQHYHHPSPMMKVETTVKNATIVTTSPQSVHSPFKNQTNMSRATIREDKNKSPLSTNSSGAVDNVSFRSAARRFSALPTVVQPAMNHHQSHLPPIPRTPKASATVPTLKATSTTNVVVQDKTLLPIPEIPTLAPLEDADATRGSACDMEASTTTSRTFKAVKRDVSFRTLAHRFASKRNSATSTIGSITPIAASVTCKKVNGNKSIPPKPTNAISSVPKIHPENQSINMKFQQRRGSTGCFVPQISPSSNFKSTCPEVIPSSPKLSQSIDAVKSHYIASPVKASVSKVNISNSVPITPPMAKTRIFVSSPAATPMSITKAYEEYFNNKVFQKRYNNAATNIQRMYRGHTQRYYVAQMISAIKIQKMVRESRERRINQHKAATTTIQKIVRGWSTRLRLRMYQLEYELRKVEQRHVRELHDIEQWKEMEYKKINESIGSENVKYMEQSKKNEEVIEKANKIIQCIRKENKKIRDKNDTLQIAINQMIEENDMLDRQAQQYKTFTLTLDEMVSVNNENTSLIALVEQFEQRKEQFDEAIARRDERIMYENTVGRLYLNRIQEMVKIIEDTCKDPKILAKIEEFCTQCNIPGTGLDCIDETTSMDISERNF